MAKTGGTRRIVFAGAAAGGAVVVLILARFMPSGQAGIAAAASLFVCAVMINCGAGYALGAFAVSSGLGLLLLPGSGTWLFALFFGYYPIIKLSIEKKMKPAIAWVVKIIVFYAAYAGLEILGIMSLFGDKWYGLLVPAAVGIVFIVYDIGYGKLAVFYEHSISAHIGGGK